jgi:hypothetical protein
MAYIQVVLIASLVVFVIARRFAGSPVRAQSFLIPAGLAAYGLIQLRGAHIGVTDLGFLVVEAVLALAIGAARGTTIRLYVRDGVLWQRYQLMTLVAWVGAIALRVGLTVVGHLAGVHVVSASLLLVLGLNFLGEALVVARRAQPRSLPERRPASVRQHHGAAVAPGRRTVRV